MPKTPINPESVFRSLEYGFSQAVLASGRQTLYLSGQTAWDAEKQIVGGRDLGAQARQAFMNIRRLVEAAGGRLDDVVSLRIYTVDYRPEHAAVVGSARMGRAADAAVGAGGGCAAFRAGMGCDRSPHRRDSKRPASGTRMG